MEEDGDFLSIIEPEHATNASDKMLKHYMPELERYVEKRYEDDYNNPLFSFQKDETVQGR